MAPDWKSLMVSPCHLGPSLSKLSRRVEALGGNCHSGLGRGSAPSSVFSSPSSVLAEERLLTRGLHLALCCCCRSAWGGGQVTDDTTVLAS